MAHMLVDAHDISSGTQTPLEHYLEEEHGALNQQQTLEQNPGLQTKTDRPILKSMGGSENS